MKGILIAIAVVATAAATAWAQGKPATPAAKPAAASAKLKNPAALNQKAPESYKVTFDTTKGAIVLEVHRAWAPLGADRFYNLVKNGFYDDVRFFRVIPNFMAQFGINGDPEVTAVWSKVILKDDPVTQSNKKGYITYGNTGRPNSRSTQLFINYKDNDFLDAQGFAPFGEVVTGMDVAMNLSSEYGTAPQNQQGTIATQGNAFLIKTYPKLDYIKKATVTN